MNLGWKLASTIHKNSSEDLLDSYERERRPVGVDIFDWSRAQVAIMKKTPESQALHAIFREVMNTRDGATYFEGRVWGINTRYDLRSDHPLVGFSVPNFEFEDGTRLGEYMCDGKGLLIDFGSSEALKKFASKQVRYLALKAKEQLKLSALLVRPDGIVAWVSQLDADERSLKEEATRWFN